MGGLSSEELKRERDDLAQERKQNAQKESESEGTEKARIGSRIDGNDRWIWYIDFLRQMHQQAKLHYQVFIEVEGHKVILATTDVE